MKDLIKIIVIVSLITLVGCSNTKQINIPQGGVVNKKIHSLEELLKSRELILPEGKTKDRDHIWYLVDGTKVEFQRCTSKNSRYMVDRISNLKYPFVEFGKEYS